MEIKRKGRPSDDGEVLGTGGLGGAGLFGGRGGGLE